MHFFHLPGMLCDPNEVLGLTSSYSSFTMMLVSTPIIVFDKIYVKEPSQPKRLNFEMIFHE